MKMPKFELGISGIIHNVLRAIRPQNRFFKKLLEKQNHFPREGRGGGGGVPLHGKFHDFLFLKNPFPYYSAIFKTTIYSNLVTGFRLADIDY